MELIGKIVLDSHEYPLFAKTVITAGICRVSIPIPEVYPETPLTDALIRKEKREFGYVEIKYTDDDMLYVRLFHIYMNLIEYRKLVSPQEHVAMKGIGKKILCMGIRALIKEFDIDTASTPVILHAAGGDCDIEMAQEYIPMSKYELLDLLKPYPKSIAMEIKRSIDIGNEYRRSEEYYEENKAYTTHSLFETIYSVAGPDVFFKMATDILKNYPATIEHRKLVMDICAIEQNKKLVEYYKRAYGLSVVDNSDGLNVKMHAPLSTVLDKCTT